MQNNRLKVLKRKTVSIWLTLIWFLVWLFAVLYAAFLFLPKRNDFIQTLTLFIVLILGHVLFFLKVDRRVLRFFSFLIELAGLVLIVISIWMLNADGTTWGAGPASLGLVLLIPSLNTFLGAARSRDHKIGLDVIITGVIGISISYWRMFEVDQKLNVGLEFWAPVHFYQNLGLFFSVLLVLAGGLNILIQGPIKVDLKKRDQGTL